MDGAIRCRGQPSGDRAGAGGSRADRQSILLHALVVARVPGDLDPGSGLSDAGLPLGMQLASFAGSDDMLLAVAGWCEARIPFRGLA